MESTVNVMSHPAKSLFESIVPLYNTLTSAYRIQYSEFCSRVLIDFESGRFWTWGKITGFTEDEAGGGVGHRSDMDLELFQEKMLSIKNTLQSAIKASEGKINNSETSAKPPPESDLLEVQQLHRSLQCLNDTLQSILPPLCQSRMEELWPHRNILPAIPKQLSVVETAVTIPQPIQPRPTAAIKYMGQLMKQGKSGNIKDLVVEKTVDINSDFGEHNLGWYKAEDSMPGSLVLVEWKGYDSRWTSGTGKELYNRIGEIAELLHNPGKHGRDSLRVLNCMGWLHDLQKFRFGFVYGIPETPVSLYTLIAQYKKLIGGPPALGMKFQLAAMLAKCLCDIHAIGWLHKNISAHNIIFTPSRDAMVSTISPYLIGFNHSRVDDEKAFTEGPNYANKHVEYQHPEYRSSDKSAQTRFHRLYDYYSLGLVLLEIGVWIPFNQIAEKKSTLSPLELRQYLIGELVPRLDERMGVIYRNAVTACLTGDFGGNCRDESDEARKETLAMFSLKVVQPLSSCFA